MAVEEGVGDLAPRLGYEAAEGGPADAHALGGLFLIQPFQVGQTQGLDLVVAQDHLLQQSRRHTARLVPGGAGAAADGAGQGRTRHRVSVGVGVWL
jgi:hypothetical protein